MKKTIILFGIILMGIINLNAQDCYTVKEINNKTENPDLSSKINFDRELNITFYEHLFYRKSCELPWSTSLP